MNVIFSHVIQGTQLYDAKKGSFVDLGILDVLQIFGRAGRPQFDTHGDAYIITTHDKLSHYLALMTRQMPIESQFISSLTDNLNAEVLNYNIYCFYIYVVKMTYNRVQPFHINYLAS